MLTLTMYSMFGLAIYSDAKWMCDWLYSSYVKIKNLPPDYIDTFQIKFEFVRINQEFKKHLKVLLHGNNSNINLNPKHT